jgi:DNA repair protein RadC
MALPEPFSSRVEPAECIEWLVPIVGKTDDEVVVLVCIDKDGYAADHEVLAQRGGDKTAIPPGLLFGFAENRGAAALMIASRSSGPIHYLHERDIRFTDSLRAFGSKIGIPLHEHVLIDNDKFRLMSESMGWNQSN